MLEAIEKLLILPESDRKILRLKTELSQMQPEREAPLGQATALWAPLPGIRLAVC